MSKFSKKKKKGSPGINTSSLPDIVFMLLFFFMVATTSKEVEPTVDVTLPKGNLSTDLTPFKQRAEIDFLYLGKPKQKGKEANFKYGYALSLDNVVQQTKDELYSINRVKDWKRDKYDQKPATMQADIDAVITCIKADQKAPSGLIFEIREALQDINALTVGYAVSDNSNI